MSEMGVYLNSPSFRITQQLLDQGLLSSQGLGNRNQGAVEPILLTPKLDRRGLGYFPPEP